LRFVSGEGPFYSRFYHSGKEKMAGYCDHAVLDSTPARARRQSTNEVKESLRVGVGACEPDIAGALDHVENELVTRDRNFQ
jgi:hypothetical protein